MAHWTVEMVLNRALLIEKQSYDLYVWARDKVSTHEAKALLNDLAEEELRHKEKISDVLKNREKIPEIGSDLKEVENLKIVDWLKESTLSDDVTYQEILIYSGKREKETYEFYLNLSERFRESDLGKLFSRLAEEEMKHKNRIEREYEKYILEEM